MRSFASPLFLILLAACAIPDATTLHHKLSNVRVPAERKEALRLACLNEAEWPVRSRQPIPYGHLALHSRQEQLQRNPEVRQMKTLCGLMDDLTSGKTDEGHTPSDLATRCATQVVAKKQEAGIGWAEHAERIARICEEMTGKHL